MPTTFKEIDGEYGSYYLVTADSALKDFRKEWWINYDDAFGWYISEFTYIPSRSGPAEAFR